MQRAWEIAREGTKKFGGKVREYFSIALKQAWFDIKKAKIKKEFECNRQFKTPKAFWNYVDRQLKKKFGCSVEDYFGCFDEWCEPIDECNIRGLRDDLEIPQYEVCKTLPYQIQFFYSKEYNYILEYDFFDGNSGFGYCYIAEMEV
ncbi:MAG: hypothetical protein HDS66_03420 [Bacteroidales bacterium]|nr:hypothetical protein [Bacteroidales bacterium]